MQPDAELVERTLDTIFKASLPMFRDRFKRGDPGSMEIYLKQVVSCVSKEWAQNPPERIQRAIERIMILHAGYFLRMFDVEGSDANTDILLVAKGTIPEHLKKWDEGWEAFLNSLNFRITWYRITHEI